FQAEDGIRDFHVTGVQTCALPILTHHDYSPYSAFDNNPVYWSDPSGADADIYKLNGRLVGASFTGQEAIDAFLALVDDSSKTVRSEERRVGKESISRW